MKYKILCIALFVGYTCLGQDIPVPTGYQVLAKAEGDLDKDKIDEWAVVYNTSDTSDSGIIREIHIYKEKGDELVLWKKSREALLKSQEGGMMGDPFGELSIHDGILTISHSGGSSWKWGYTDKYRFQNGEFALIGHTSNYGKVCEYWGNVDFNLSTGKIIYVKEFENCDKEDAPVIYKTEEETFYKKGVSLNLNNRFSKEVRITSPKYKVEIGL